MGSARPLLIYAHLGDLHLTSSKEQHFTDLLAIAAEIELQCRRQLDFVYLPGDIADNGKAEEYALVHTALKMLGQPVHAITGDHDMASGNLDNFLSAYSGGHGFPPLPFGVTHGGVRCLFLDICGPGRGGPDFRLGDRQMAWVEQQLASAEAAEEPAAVFMHGYPADLVLPAEKERLNRLLAGRHVHLVDMGHTHYNELANDGRTIFAATRSTGQIEEGPVGYSLTAIDGGGVSWQFKPLEEVFPVAMITAPADRRLVVDQDDPAQVVGGAFEVHAVVFGADRVAACRYRIDDGAWQAMTSPQADDRLWRARARSPGGRWFSLAVRAETAAGEVAEDRIEVAAERFEPPSANRDGSDKDAIEAWPERHLFGTQLGPNRNGRKW